MEKHTLNIDNILTVEDLYDIGWLHKDLKRDEIVLQTSELDFNAIRLKATFYILCEAILNSHRRKHDDPKVEINYDQYEFLSLEELAEALTNETGIRFTSGLAF